MQITHFIEKRYMKYMVGGCCQQIISRKSELPYETALILCGKKGIQDLFQQRRVHYIL